MADGSGNTLRSMRSVGIADGSWDALRSIGSIGVANGARDTLWGVIVAIMTRDVGIMRSTRRPADGLALNICAVAPAGQEGRGNR